MLWWERQPGLAFEQFFVLAWQISPRKALHYTNFSSGALTSYVRNFQLIHVPSALTQIDSSNINSIETFSCWHPNWHPFFEFCDSPNKKANPKIGLNIWFYWEFFGRDGVIRTLDPLHPMQVRYQAALRPDEPAIIAEWNLFCLCQ